MTYSYTSPPPPTHYPPPPPPNCNMTMPKPVKPPPPPRPPQHPNCSTSVPPSPPPPPPLIPNKYNCTRPPPPPNSLYPPPPPVVLAPNYPPPYVFEHLYKALIAVSVSLGGILVAFLLLGAFSLAKLKMKKPMVNHPPPPTSQNGPPQQTTTASPPTSQDGPPQQTTTAYEEAIPIQQVEGGGAAEVIDIQHVVEGGGDAAGRVSYEPGEPAPVVHDHGHDHHQQTTTAYEEAIPIQQVEGGGAAVVIDIQHVVEGGGDAAGRVSYEPGEPAPVVHDHGHDHHQQTTTAYEEAIPIQQVEGGGAAVVIDIQHVVEGGGDAAGRVSYEPGEPAPVVHDHGHDHHQQTTTAYEEAIPIQQVEGGGAAEVIDIQHVVEGGGDATGRVSYEPGEPAPVVHDHGHDHHQHYGQSSS